MDERFSRVIVGQYLATLKRMDERYSAWNDSELPFPKEIIQKAIEKDLLGLKTSNEPSRQELVMAYIALARFVSPDDAQLVKQTEKTTLRITEKVIDGEGLDAKDDDLISLYEIPFVRIRSEERRVGK